MSQHLVKQLRNRFKKVLPSGWKKELKCPECGSIADRPKCFYEWGSSCPRHDPDNYDPSPYKKVPDQLCLDAADRIEELQEICKRLMHELEVHK